MVDVDNLDVIVQFNLDARLSAETYKTENSEFLKDGKNFDVLIKIQRTDILYFQFTDDFEILPIKLDDGKILRSFLETDLLIVLVFYHKWET